MFMIEFRVGAIHHIFVAFPLELSEQKGHVASQSAFSS